MKTVRSALCELMLGLSVWSIADVAAADAAAADVVSEALSGKTPFDVALTQSLSSSRTQLTRLEPVLAYELVSGWSVPAGDLQFRIDWAKERASNLPLGVQLGVVCPVFEQPIRFFVSPQYNLKDTSGTDRFKVMVGFALLAPDAESATH
jgi:hypothetical protein